MATITSVTDKRGRFLQGDWGVLMLAITDTFGNPKDAEEITVKIYQGSDIVEFDVDIPLQVDNGNYVFEWAISGEQAIGTYVIDWMFTIDDVDYVETQSVIIHSGADTTGYSILYNERLIAFREGLENLIICAQQIPVYFEQSKPSFDRKKFSFTYGRWNQSQRVKVYRNKKILTEGVTVNYFKGNITFEEEVLPQDIVNMDYDFRWFSDDELDQFLNNAMMAFNSFPPVQNYNLLNVPAMHMPAILYGAAKDALRQLMMCLQFQEPQLVFGGPERAQTVFGNIETLKQNYEKDWDKLTDVKKYGKYPTMKLVIVPEYTLPGGRSRWFRYLFK
ncbi:MAG: hypothetical protein KAH05_06970 [Clostridiales bacterium]|nr:hypothetical protein [Clostridiales bacterium]